MMGSQELMVDFQDKIFKEAKKPQKLESSKISSYTAVIAIAYRLTLSVQSL